MSIFPDACHIHATIDLSAKLILSFFNIQYRHFFIIPVMQAINHHNPVGNFSKSACKGGHQNIMFC